MNRQSPAHAGLCPYYGAPALASRTYERIVLAISYAGATSLRQFSEIGMTGWVRRGEELRASLAPA